MVGFGFLMLGLGLWSLWARWKGPPTGHHGCIARRC